MKTKTWNVNWEKNFTGRNFPIYDITHTHSPAHYYCSTCRNREVAGCCGDADTVSNFPAVTMGM